MRYVTVLRRIGARALRRIASIKMPKRRKAEDAPAAHPPLSQSELIAANIAEVHASIATAAMQGTVPDAFVRRLAYLHGVGLTNDLNQLEGLEQRFEASCRRLEAMFPEPPPPEPKPEPEEPVAPPRHFQRLGSLFAEGNRPALQ